MIIFSMLLEPTVYDECERAVYEDLWDSARMLTESEAKPYARSPGLRSTLKKCRVTDSIKGGGGGGQ